MRVASVQSGLNRAAPWILVVVIAGGLVGFAISTGDDTTLLDYLLLLAGVAFAAVGALILARTSGNRIGWVLAVTGLLIVGSGLLSELADNSQSEQTRLISAALGGALFFSLFFLFGLLLYWFPTGRAVSPRWRWGLWLGVGGCALAATHIFTEELCLEEAGDVCVSWARNPVGIPGVPHPEYGPLSGLTFGLLVGFAFISAGSLIARYVRTRDTEKLQIKWLAFVVVSVLSLIILWQVLDDFIYLPWSEAFFGLSILSLPLAVGISVMRYRLYDIDRIISRTVAYALVVAVLAITYLAVVVGVGAIAAAASPSNLDLPLPVLAAALVAIGFQPVRERALRLANRLVFGRRRTPYEALAGIEEVELHELLPQIARLVAESTTAHRAIVWMSNGSQLEPAATFPDDSATPEPMQLIDGQIPSSVDGATTFPLINRGRLLGAITTVLVPGEVLPADDKRLIMDLASHAARTVNEVLEATPLPEGIVTFLMTDIEGSTRLWEEDPERMAAALREHDEFTRRTISASGGILIKWRGEGDSTFSVFTDPVKAIEASMALQEAIKLRRWDLVRPIDIRAALHTGEAELRERDYFGQTVNRCARLRSLAHGGQTLITAATRELVRSGALDNLAFKDLGEHQLRDLSEPERVYEVLPKTSPRSPNTATIAGT
jgi:class 3 adenylate cyclase/MFS family permease